MAVAVKYPDAGGVIFDRSYELAPQVTVHDPAVGGVQACAAAPASWSASSSAWVGIVAHVRPMFGGGRPQQERPWGSREGRYIARCAPLA